MSRTGSLVIALAMCLAAWPAAAASVGPYSAEAGYLMVQGRQVLLLTSPTSEGLAGRGAEIRRRLEAAVSKDGTLQPVGRVRLIDVAGTPMLSVGELPVASVTPWDAARAGQPAWALAHRWADALEGSLATLQLGGPVPEGLVLLKGTTGAAIALGPSAPEPGPIAIEIENGRMTATIASGVVTLTGRALTLGEKIEVARRIAAVPGVVDLVNSLVVASARAVSDADLASALGHTIAQ